jgi:Kef-type K+ transport system membrane component KefB
VSAAVKAAVVSFVTTFVVTFAAAISVAGFDFNKSTLVAAALAAVRTAVAAVNPFQTLYGVGAKTPQ